MTNQPWTVAVASQGLMKKVFSGANDENIRFL
jgi:hypothetical protein